MKPGEDWAVMVASPGVRDHIYVGQVAQVGPLYFAMQHSVGVLRYEQVGVPGLSDHPEGAVSRRLVGGQGVIWVPWSAMAYCTYADASLWGDVRVDDGGTIDAGAPVPTRPPEGQWVIAVASPGVRDHIYAGRVASVDDRFVRLHQATGILRYEEVGVPGLSHQPEKAVLKKRVGGKGWVTIPQKATAYILMADNDLWQAAWEELGEEGSSSSDDESD